MKISELLARLAEMLEEHGDVRVLNSEQEPIKQVMFESSSEREAVIIR